MDRAPRIAAARFFSLFAFAFYWGIHVIFKNLSALRFVAVLGILAAVTVSSNAPAQEKQPRKYGIMSGQGMPQKWFLQQDKSSVSYRNRSASSQPIPITNYDMDLNFDPNKLEQSRIVITADVSSMFLPANAVNLELLEYLPPSTTVAKGTPSTAMFMSTVIKRSGSNNFVAEGGLRVGGKSRALSIPFSVTLDKNVPGGMMIILKGEFTAQRSDFATEDYSKTGSSDVPIQFELAAIPVR